MGLKLRVSRLAFLRLGRAGLWALPMLAAAGALLAMRQAGQRADLAVARLFLIEGRAAEAAELFGRHRGQEAQAGLALTRAYTGEPSSPGGGLSLASFPLPLLIEGALHRRDFEACRRLAILAKDGGEATAPAYLSAALLELGRDEEALAALDTAPEVLRSAGLGREVARALELRASGARALVRDGRGALAGTFDSGGRFVLLDQAVAGWVPAAARTEAARAGPEAGVRLSVDFDLSRLAEASLGGYRGSIVLLDPLSGAVLAAVSDHRTLQEGGTPAFEQRREPASIVKIITATAALRAGLDPDAEISRMTCSGSERYGAGTLWCSSAAGRLGGLAHALAISCNVAFANLGIKLGREALLEELRLWGFDGGTTGAGSVPQAPEDELQLARLAIGLDATDITPLHAARMAAILAHGTMPEPLLVTASDGALGLSPAPLPPPTPRPVLDPRWLAILTRAMEAVTAPGGTAEGVDPPGFQVAMKTGTASAPGLGYHVNYIGLGALPDPRIAFCVRLTHQPTSPQVTRAAREVTASLLEGLQQRKGRRGS